MATGGPLRVCLRKLAAGTFVPARFAFFDGAARGTRTPTVTRLDLNQVRLPIPP